MLTCLAYATRLAISLDMLFGTCLLLACLVYTTCVLFCFGCMPQNNLAKKYKLCLAIVIWAKRLQGYVTLGATVPPMIHNMVSTGAALAYAQISSTAPYFLVLPRASPSVRSSVGRCVRASATTTKTYQGCRPCYVQGQLCAGRRARSGGDQGPGGARW